ncbi:MAG: DUF2264 domain-containing protein [Butyrivibrio sp.]|nr:DUF2264 domain-containing protein [Butyrivibrio sp.]
MSFIPTHTDYEKSPFTGLTRESWMDAGRYLLEGIFSHLDSIDAPLVMPRKETEITYPHLNDPPEQQDAQRRAEVFEGLTRSFFIASVLIHDDPGLEIAGIPIRAYYRKHILRVCTPGDPVYVSTYEELQEMTGHQDPFRCFQQTVETCALVIGLWACRGEIWEDYSEEEQGVIIRFLKSYAHNNTVPQNWRLFCMLDMAFLADVGADIDERIMMDHAHAILAYYAGNGWYRDGQSFDYYSCWAFNFYAPLWCRWWGYAHAPEIAACFEAYSNELMRTYGRFFDRDGSVNMWGRSNIYRNAATSAFDGNLFLENNTVDPGWARRISSGALLQFLGRDDFLWEGIPTLGFYGQFAPLVQGYSCAESPFWLGKAFLCLHLDETHPFWTATENEGDWAGLGDGEVLETVLDGPGLCFTNHQRSGATILRTGKVVKRADDRHGMWNYAKLAFHTKYPWEASPVESGGACREDVESQQYVLHDLTTDRYSRGNATFWAGVRDGVLYRRQFFDYGLDREMHWIQSMDLADCAVPEGILRIDRHRLHRRPVRFTLGAWGFPDNGTQVERRNRDGAEAVILRGTDHMGHEKQLAMTICAGWERLSLIHSTGTNPDSAHSIIIYAETTLHRQYDGSEPYVLISQTLTRESAEPFTDDELFPVARVEWHDRYQTGAYGPVELVFRDGSRRIIDFEGVEGRLTL